MIVFSRLADLGARINGWLAGPELAPFTVFPLRRRETEFSKSWQRDRGAPIRFAPPAGWS
jgi:hypothetical protein